MGVGGGWGGRGEGAEAEERRDIFWMSSPVLCASLSVSEPDWKWQQQQQQHP